MRTLFLSILLIFSIVVKAQTVLQDTYIGRLQPHLLTDNNSLKDSTGNKKWFVNKYIGLSSGFSFFNGGHATVLSVPIGIQLNRRLTNNWYAFAGVVAAPAYINFNHSFVTGNANKWTQQNTFLQSNRLDLYSRAELGLMYINDQKTFSISGSIGFERSSYPLVPVNQQLNTFRPNNFVAPKK